jgi:hypothetical protein
MQGFDTGQTEPRDERDDTAHDQEPDRRESDWWTKQLGSTPASLGP